MSRECRRASLVIAQSIRRGDALLLDAEVRVAALSAATFRPKAIPQSLYDELDSLVENDA